MVISADTSFLFSLYGNDVHTSRALHWLEKHQMAITLSVFAEYGLANALRWAEFCQLIKKGSAELILAQYRSDRDAGRIIVQPCNLASVVSEAKRLSATYTLAKGHRAFDILYVAAAICLRAQKFLSFDANQQKLAIDEGLSVPFAVPASPGLQSYPG